MKMKEELRTQEACEKFHQTEAEIARRKIEKLKHEIAEAEKPKLRHGDQFHDGIVSIVATLGETWRFYYPDGGYNERETEKAALEFIEACGYKFLANVFDDSKALQEPLTEVEAVCRTGRDKVTITPNGGGADCPFVFRQKGCDVRMNPEQFDKFVMDCRRMQATQKREQK